jgi:hypothetical protein
MAKYIISGPMVSTIRKASQHIMSKVATQDAPQYPCSHHFMVAFIFICQRKRGKGKGRKAILCTKLKSVVTQIQKLIGASCVTTENAASAYLLATCKLLCDVCNFLSGLSNLANSCQSFGGIPPQEEK